MRTPDPKTWRIAVMALGGQGGGVLVDWIVDLAEHAGWTAQATSVAGVAQRTGATIYYIELVEPTPGREPVMALMPVPGDVDVLIAAELMEAGRAVERGLVTPDRTVLVASSHRTYAVQEKIVPGNGLADSAAVLDVLRGAARQLVVADMQALAVGHGSVISASLFGGLAGSGALPFERAAFEAVIERSGVGVKASLAAMRAAAELASATAPVVAPPSRSMETPPRPLPERAAAPALQPLVDRIRQHFPRPAWDWLGEGLARVVDWQDADYGREYLDHVAALAAADDGSEGHALTIEAARWVAVAMSYDDVIRVADLKTRAERTARVRGEIGAKAEDVFGTEEYFHPRLEEALGLLPRAWADRVEASPALKSWVAAKLDKGRRIHSQTLAGHLQLRLMASLRRWRRGNRRHAQEQAHLQAWLQQVQATLKTDRALALEELRCRRLVKGYSDTHARGSSRFDKLMQAARLLRGKPQAAQTLASLREAALKDAEGRALEQQLKALALG
ncbi:MAG: indolepyruvate oxidoreductase subunit beta family protein [Rubrivivax sp.]